MELPPLLETNEFGEVQYMFAMKPQKTSQELEIERVERNAAKWAKRKQRAAEYKKKKI
jgi:hypothetical protein